ncbi:MAG: ribosome biogenesis GTPase YlqF, partial [Christensenellaceae bacterium]|nr:ribosome biogenesis GTPase YlqF [Christensenellaceae bacterium]
NIQWYPGHMTKSRREMESKMGLIDLVVEVCDARAPLATLNPDFSSLFGQKKRMYILNKSDMADPKATEAWLQYFRSQGIFAVAYSALTGNPKELQKSIRSCAQEIYDKYAKKGMKKTVRAIVCGIPNVGKSAILNRLAGQKKLKEGNMPGVTRGLQWVKLDAYLELMDSPGMLPPKIVDMRSGVIIASIGSIRRDILDEEKLVQLLIEMLREINPQALMNRYKLKELDENPIVVLEEICKQRGFYIMKGEVDYDRGITTLFEEFKNAKLGRITLELPPKSEEETDAE